MRPRFLHEIHDKIKRGNSHVVYASRCWSYGTGRVGLGRDEVFFLSLFEPGRDRDHRAGMAGSFAIACTVFLSCNDDSPPPPLPLFFPVCFFVKKRGKCSCSQRRRRLSVDEDETLWYTTVVSAIFVKNMTVVEMRKDASMWCSKEKNIFFGKRTKIITFLTFPESWTIEEKC